MPGGKTLIWILIFLASTLLLDRFVFDYLIFQPANHSGWDSYRWYNFEWNFRFAERSFASDQNESAANGTSRADAENDQKLSQPGNDMQQQDSVSDSEPGPEYEGKQDSETNPKPAGNSREASGTEPKNKTEPYRIVVLGSSIARYSVQTEVLEQLLRNRLNHPVQVELISHAAMMPEDAFHYTPRINAMKPDLVVYPMALVDLDLEHLTPPHIPGPAFDTDAHFEFLKRRVPAQRFYPASFAWEHLDRLSLTEISSGLMSGLLAGIRFSGQWWDALEFNRKSESGSPLKSYIYYQGKPLAGGLYREGKTSGCVAFPASYAGDELNFEIPPELFTPGFKITLEWFSADVQLSGLDSDMAAMWEPHWEKGYEYPAELLRNESMQRKLFFADPCNIDVKPVRSRDYRADGSGWKKIPLASEERQGWVRLKLSHVIVDNSLQPVSDANRRYGEGLRMPGQFGLEEAPVDQVQHRRWFLEDQRLMDLTDLEYLKDYMQRIQPDNWKHRPALIPYNNLRIVKTYLPVQDFVPVYQLKRLKDVRNRLDCPMLLILNPENPVESAVFEDSQYFADFKEYLHREHGAGYVSLHDELPMQYFADPHHFTYFGMLRMTPRYADLIVAALQSGH
ncbi:MAG: hypothetical protein CMN77_18770 [Spirochaetaceae bacterium]|nr:hypothetical protein [Spirochaetaceae bacterium]|tara:strand:- start:20807 stop:22675 length:1869 start_codon:yes stop_codon:yes gene_type:complete